MSDIEDIGNSGGRVGTGSTRWFLGEAIRHYRTERLTQAEARDKAGLHRSYLSSGERKGDRATQAPLRVLRQLGVRMTLDKADW